VPQRLALLVATYRYQDAGLRQLTAPGHDAEALAEVLRDPRIADFDVTILVNEPHHVVGDAIGEFYHSRRRDDLTLLYFTGHGLKDDHGRLYLAMTDTKRDRLLFTGISAQQIDEAIESCSSRQKVLMLDCCYSGAFPANSIPKADPQVYALEKFQGRGRVVLTASDATQYSFEGNHIIGKGTRSVFTRFLVEGLITGKADLDGDGNISLDELYSYVHDRVVAETPQQRPRKQENVEGRIIIARNIHWSLPAYIRTAIESPVARDRLAALENLAHLHRVGNDFVQAQVIAQTRRLLDDDSKTVSATALKLITALNPEQTQRDAEEKTQPDAEATRWVPAVSSNPRRISTEEQQRQVRTSPTPSLTADNTTARSDQLELETCADQYPPTRSTTEKQIPHQTRHKANGSTALSWWSEPTLRRWYKKQDRHSAEGQNITETQASEHIRLLDSWRLARLTRRQMGLAASATLMVTLLIVILVVIIHSLMTTTIPTVPTVTTTIPVGSYPVGVAITPDGGHAYVANANSKNVSVIDTGSNTVTATIPGSSPTRLAITPDGRYAYVTNYYSNFNTVSVIDIRSNTVTATIPVGTSPVSVAITPDSRHAYVTNTSSNNVSVIDIRSNTVTATIPVGTSPSGVAITPDGQHAYVTNYYSSSNNVSVIDTGSNTVTATIPVGAWPESVEITPDGRHAYVTNHGSNNVSVIDTGSNIVSATIPVGSAPADVAITPDGRQAYVLNNGSNNVSVIDTGSNTVTATIPVGSSWAVAITPDGRHAYVTNYGSNIVSIIEVGTG
jgi:YVTN family beta-propeller protein